MVVVALLIAFYGYGFRFMMDKSILDNGGVNGRRESSWLTGCDSMSWKKVRNRDGIDKLCVENELLKSGPGNLDENWYIKVRSVIGIRRETSVYIIKIGNEDEAGKMRKLFGVPAEAISIGDMVVYELRIVSSRPAAVVSKCL